MGLRYMLGEKPQNPYKLGTLFGNVLTKTVALLKRSSRVAQTDPATIGKTYTLYVGWDGSIFTFKSNDNIQTVAATEVTPVAYKFPRLSSKGLETRVVMGVMGG